jgi:N-methylhydantoinase A/oxoprolinase/acetone carboxylase beta subunit
MDGKANVGEREREILEQITSQPIAYRKIAVSSTAQRAIASLRNRGLLQLAAFTPSDAAHVLDLQNNWSRDCAYLAAKITSRNRDMKEPTDERVTILCRDVHHAVVAASAKVIMQSVLPAGDGTSSLVDHVANGVRQLGLAEIIIRPHIPIVAVGGPAVVYYPEVGRRLDCEIILAEGASVANSIGAAAGTVAHRVVVSVEGDGSGLFKVFDGATARTVASGTQALTVAQELACAQAIAMAESFGARSPTVEISVTKSLMPEAVDDEGLLTASITALARAEAV